MNIKEKLINQIKVDSVMLNVFDPKIEFFGCNNKFNGEGVIGVYIIDFDLELSVFCSDASEYYASLSDCLTQWRNWIQKQNEGKA